MKKLKIGGAVAAVFLALSSWASSLEVTDVKIAQRYPWNGLVDITYTVTSDDANKDVWVYPVGYDADTATSVALMPQYLSGEGASNAVHQGTHQMTWNMAAQMGKNYNRAAFSVKLHAFCDAAPYMVIDLSAGSNADKYEVSYLPEIPEGGWTDEPYKTTKMVFRLILPSEGHAGVVLTKPYYFAIFPVTEQQYCLIAGGTTAYPTAWKSYVSYDELRGTILGSKWPQHQQVDASSPLGRMRLRTGITIDLPTSEQWYRAARADGHTNCVDPNAWGIRGLGTIGEWNLNWYGTMTGADPAGPTGNERGTRAVSGRYYPASTSLNVTPYAYFGSIDYAYTCTERYSSRQDFVPSVNKAYYARSDVGGYVEGFGVRLVALPVSR